MTQFNAFRLAMAWSIAASLHFSSSNVVSAQETNCVNLKSESFDRDPDWEGFNNRIVPNSYLQITQDFGFSSTNFAGRSTGEMGGRVFRATESSFYGDKKSNRKRCRTSFRLQETLLSLRAAEVQVSSSDGSTADFATAAGDR